MPSRAATATSRRQARVLALDDQALVRDLWVEALHEAGYDALGVARSDDALARLAELAPDLILLDMMMPHMCSESRGPHEAGGRGRAPGSAQTRHRARQSFRARSREPGVIGPAPVPGRR